MKKYAADFETTTDEKDCRIWAYSLCNIDDPEDFIYGTTFEEFMEWCAEPKQNYTLYFHNLKFDGSFIIAWLLEHGFEYISDKKDRRDLTFTTLITDMGQFYCIEIYFKVTNHHSNKVKILDSLKIFPGFSVERVAEGFDLPIRKLEIDYKLKRPEGWKLTQQEIDYIRNDVEIMARALHIMFEQGLTKMTIAGDAFANYKEFVPGFRKRFPILPKAVDADIRLSYRGGFTYCNDIYIEQEMGHGITLDVNSLYPSRMTQEYLPYGMPEFFEGEYQEDAAMPLYIQSLTCKFDLKDGKIPNIQLKNNLSFIPNEYLKSSKDELVTLSLCSPDYELFRENYNVSEITFHGGWKFRQCKGMFDEYINYWMEQKIKAGKEGNQPMRQIAKLMLNSLYGRFGLSINARQKYPYLDDKGIVRFALLPEEEREPVYIPVACFITAYGRCKTIRTSQAIRDYSIKKYGRDAYLYSDTDSIKCMLTDEDLEELKDIVEIDDYALGAWAKEEEFDRFLMIRQKCYITETNGKVHPTVAGLPKYLAPLITFDNFKRGFSTEGLTLEKMVDLASKNGASLEDIKKLHHKLTYKYVQGGVILEDTDFTIKQAVENFVKIVVDIINNINYNRDINN